MSNAVQMGWLPLMATTFSYPATRGVFANAGVLQYKQQQLPTDPIGVITATFRGVKANTEIRVYSATGIELAGVEDCVANQVLVWPTYSPGSTELPFRIVLVNLAYGIQTLEFENGPGPTNISIQQLPDRWFSNPA